MGRPEQCGFHEIDALNGAVASAYHGGRLSQRASIPGCPLSMETFHGLKRKWGGQWPPHFIFQFISGLREVRCWCAHRCFYPCIGNEDLVLRMSAIAARIGDQSATRIQNLIPERDTRLPCCSCKQIKMVLSLHHREARDFPTLLKRVPVHPEMDERHSKFLYKPH